MLQQRRARVQVGVLYREGNRSYSGPMPQSLGVCAAFFGNQAWSNLHPVTSATQFHCAKLYMLPIVEKFSEPAKSRATNATGLQNQEQVLMQNIQVVECLWRVNEDHGMCTDSCRELGASHRELQGDLGKSARFESELKLAEQLFLWQKPRNCVECDSFQNLGNKRC